GSDYDEHKIGASWGSTWKGGSVFLAYENGRRSSLNGADRDYFTSYQSATADYRVPRCAPGNIVVAGVSYAIPVGGVTAANVDELTPGSANLCENLKYQDILPEQEYDNFAFTSTFDITHDLSVYLDGYWANRDFQRDAA